MDDFELLLIDRLGVIRDTIAKYGEENFYIAFSGGKDSTVVSHLIDMAIPENKIPRVFANTGIEYNKIVEFVRSLAKKTRGSWRLNLPDRSKRCWRVKAILSKASITLDALRITKKARSSG